MFTWSRICRLLLLAVVAFTLTGCVARIGPGGAAPGWVYTNVTYPNKLNPGMNYRVNFERDDIEILGPVSVEAPSEWYFFVFAKGDSGFSELMEQVREQGGDGVMNVTVDTSYRNYLLFYAEITVEMSGIAYRYKRAEDYEKPPEP